MIKLVKWPVDQGQDGQNTLFLLGLEQDGYMGENGLSAEILADPSLVLKSPAVLTVLKKHWLANHENLVQPEKFVAEFFGGLEASDAMPAAEIKKYYKKKLKEYRNAGLPAEKPGDMFLELIRDRLADAGTVLDFGCGKLAYLKNMAEQNGNIKKMIGIDPKSQPVLDGLDPRIGFMRSLDDVADGSTDLVVVKLVLHHLQDEQEAKNIFAELKRVLRPGGKLVIFEESFPAAPCGTEEIESYLAGSGLAMSPVTQDFLRLSVGDKIKFLFLNDWLMNLQNPYMPWTGSYKSMENWIRLVESAGFQKQEAHFLGAIKHRKRKQGMTAMLVFSNPSTN